MFDIIALIFLTRKIGALAARKGQVPRRWKLNTVLAWLGLEIVGVFIGIAISGNLYMASLLGLTSAVGGYLLMRYQLERMPDAASDHWMDRIGQPDA